MIDLNSRINPTIATLADPSSEALLRARVDVQNNEAVKEMFLQQLANDWTDEELAAQVAAALQPSWGEDDPSEAVQYLVDEFRQLGEGIHLVCKETGRVLTTLKEADIYQPALVPRENGSMATPLKRIRPDLEAAVVTWLHDTEREKEIVAKLAERGSKTVLLKEMNDPRLLVATKRGRKHIVDSLGRFDPKVLLEAASGTSAAFLSHFKLVGEVPLDTTGLVHLKGKVGSKSIMGIQDQTTVNLHHNRAATIQGALVQGWVRELARIITQDAKTENALKVSMDALAKLEGELWVLPPESVLPFRRLNRQISAMPVEHSHATVFTGPAGYILVPDTFKAKSFEFFDRWEAASEVEYEIWYDPKALKPVTVHGEAFESQVL